MYPSPEVAPNSINNHPSQQTSNLHHPLFCYIKSYQYRATKDGIPLICAIFLEVPEDLQTYEIYRRIFLWIGALDCANCESRWQEDSVLSAKRYQVPRVFEKTNVYMGGTSSTIQMSTDFIRAYVVECAIVPRGDIYQGNNKWSSNWQPHLEIEVYPSYGCKNSTFLYYTGNDQVEITMVADS
jgi:hypothetical protein